MKNKRNVFLLLTLLLLAGCSNNNSDDSSLPPGSSSSSEPGISESSSEGSSSSESSSEELLPISDPDVPGLERSEVWPSEALYGFLRYTDMFNMPELTSETSFHHGLYNDELFYRVLTRVHRPLITVNSQMFLKRNKTIFFVFALTTVLKIIYGAFDITTNVIVSNHHSEIQIKFDIATLITKIFQKGLGCCR